MKRTIAFAAIAASIIIGCSEQEVTTVGLGEGTSEIAVEMAFDQTGTPISEATHEAVAVITRGDGTKDITKLIIKDSVISGLVKTKEGKDTLKVDVEVTDKDKKVTHKGTDIVIKNGKLKFETVGGNLIDLKKIVGNDLKKGEHKGTGTIPVISAELLAKYIPLLLGKNVDQAVAQALIKTIINDFKWTEKDLYLIETFIKLIINATDTKIGIIIISGDTLKIKDGIIGKDSTIVKDSIYLTNEQIGQMIAAVAVEYKVSAEKLAVAVKTNAPELFTKWPISAKEKAYAIIRDQARKLVGGIADTTPLFTEAQLKDLALSEAKMNNVSGEKLLAWLSSNGFFKKQFTLAQKAEVLSWIRKGIISIVESKDSTVVTTLFTEAELKDMALSEAKMNNVSGEKLLAWLSNYGFFKKQFTLAQKFEVMSWIKKGIISILEIKDSTVVTTLFTEAQLKEIALAEAKANNVSGEKLLACLYLDDFFGRKFTLAQKADVLSWIKMSITYITLPVTDSIHVDSVEITQIALEMASGSNISPKKLISYLRDATKLYYNTWTKAQYAEIRAIIKQAIVQIGSTTGKAE